MRSVSLLKMLELLSSGKTVWQGLLGTFLRASYTTSMKLAFNLGGERHKTSLVVRTERCSNIAGTEHSETITAPECIAAAGLSMALFYIFKGQVPQEDWYYSSDSILWKTLTAIIPIFLRNLAFEDVKWSH
jgi:hypothetical protein